MRRLLLAALALLTAPLYASNTTLTATQITQALNGVLLPAGRLCLTPVLNGQPSGFSTGSAQVMPTQVCYQVLNGGLSSVVTVPDTGTVTPQGIGFQVQVQDADGTPLYNFPAAIYPTGATWSLDAWTPPQSVLITSPALTFNNAAPQGRCGTAPALWYTPYVIYACQNQIWLPAATGSGAAPFSGGTVTSPITLPADPTQPLQASTKNYVDTSVATALPLAGGTMTGAIVLPSNPTISLQAAPKQYVDTSVATALPLTGGTLTGALNLAADPTTTNQAATKHYVDITAAATGNVSGTGTTGYIPSFSGAAAIGNSPLNYGVTQSGVVTSTAPFSMAEAAAPTAVAGYDILHAGSTSHRLKMSNNGGTFLPIVGLVGTATSGDLPAINSSGYDIYDSTIALSNVAVTNTNTYFPQGITVATGITGTLNSAESVASSATPTFSTTTRASYIVLTANVTTFTLPAGVDGQEKTIDFRENATGGFTVTPPSNVIGGFASFTTTANAHNATHFTYYATPGQWIADASASGGGSVTGSGVTGKIPLWSGASALGVGHLDDGLTTASVITSTEAVAVADASGIGGGMNAGEGTAATASAANDVFWADSTAHRLLMNNNNTGALKIVGIGAAGTSGHLAVLATNGIDITDGGVVPVSGGTSPYTPTLTADAGAGTSPTSSLTAGSNDDAGWVNLTEGTSPTVSAGVITVVYGGTYSAARKCIVEGSNAAAAALSGTARVFVPASQSTATNFVITGGATALTAGTVYQFAYRCTN